jgi:uncharacterized membrane protein
VSGTKTTQACTPVIEAVQRRDRISPRRNKEQEPPGKKILNEPTGNLMQLSTPEEKMQSLKTLTTVVYALYAATFISGITCIIAIVINYVKKDDVAGTWLESHFRWQIRTFWYGLLWMVVGGLTWIIVIGWIVLAVNGVWLIYRIVKGWLNLNDNKPMYTAP